jgi:Ca2+-binding EF-hand superfamily protein
MERAAAHRAAPDQVVEAGADAGETAVTPKPGSTAWQQQRHARQQQKQHHRVFDALYARKREAFDVFSRLDTDKDGTVSKEEMKQHNKEPRVARLMHRVPASTIAIQADENGDGMVDKAEYAAWYVDRMESDKRNHDEWRNADMDKDGLVTYEEYKGSTIAQKVPMPSACPAGFVPGPADTVCKGAAKSRTDVAKALFQRMDRDGDAKVSKKEFLAYRHPDDHTAADVDGDGVLTKQEFMLAPKQYRGYKPRSRGEKEAEYKLLDKNGDGKITRQEFEHHMRLSKIHAIHGHHPRSSVDESDWVSWNEPQIAIITHRESTQNVQAERGDRTRNHVEADHAQLRKETRSPLHTGTGLSQDDILEF